MKSLIIALLLTTTPVIATPTEEDYCAYIVPELEEAVRTGLIEQYEVDKILERCYRVYQ